MRRFARAWTAGLLLAAVCPGPARSQADADSATAALDSVPVAADSSGGAAPISPPAPADEKERELQDLRTRIREHRARADQLATDEKGQVARLHELEREADLTSKLLARLSDKQGGLEARAVGIEGEIAQTQARLDDRRQRLAQRLRTLYKQGGHHTLQLMLTSAGLDELAARMKAQTEIARAEQRLIDEVKMAQWELRGQRFELDRNLAEVYRTRSEVEDRKLQLTSAQDQRKRALVAVRQERQRFLNTVEELEQAARDLESLVAALEQRRQDQGAPAPSTQFAAGQGRLPWPVNGKVIKPFGRSVHPQFKTVVMNKGVNIAAAAGTPITAVAPGVVEFVDWLPGYGKCIILNHGDGYYTLYAHASEVFFGAGAHVQRGEVVGEVGDTGSLNGSQLYFEVRHGKEALDPTQWLGRLNASR